MVVRFRPGLLQPERNIVKTAIAHKALRLQFRAALLCTNIRTGSGASLSRPYLFIRCRTSKNSPVVIAYISQTQATLLGIQGFTQQGQSGKARFEHFLRAPKRVVSEAAWA